MYRNPTSTMDVDVSRRNCDKCDDYSRRILITGGAGFIGSHVVIHLVEKYPNYFIVNLDKLDYCSSVRNLDQIKDKPNYKFIQGDICEADFMRDIFQDEKIDTVMHFAAQSLVDLSFGCSLDYTHTNVYGSHVLVNAAHIAGIKRFIHVSTDEVYGGRSLKPLTEDAKLNPTNPYAATKAAAECIVSSYWECFKFPVIITRANNVYGPHQYPRAVVPKFICLLERDKKCYIHGDGSTMRNFLYVSDVAEAYDTILHKAKAGEIYNIGTERTQSIADLAKELIQRLKNITEEDKIEEHMEFVEDRPYNDKSYPMDSTKLSALGWQPTVSWREGLEKTIAWYQCSENFHSWPTADEALSPFPAELKFS